jgi:DNA-binding response OmpR family regulator
MPLRLLVADDREMVRQGVQALREAEGFAVVGSIGTARDAARLALTAVPDITVLNSSVAEWNGRAVMSYRVLLVDTDPATTAALEQVLVSAGYRVAAVRSFEYATRQVALDCPDLMVTAIRLGQFNGLHLVLRCRADFPNMPVIVVGGAEDVGFAAEAVRYGARFVTRPIDPRAFIALVTEVLAGQVPHDP